MLRRACIWRRKVPSGKKIFTAEQEAGRATSLQLWYRVNQNGLSIITKLDTRHNDYRELTIIPRYYVCIPQPLIFSYFNRAGHSSLFRRQTECLWCHILLHWDRICPQKRYFTQTALPVAAQSRFLQAFHQHPLLESLLLQVPFPQRHQFLEMARLSRAIGDRCLDYSLLLDTRWKRNLSRPKASGFLLSMEPSLNNGSRWHQSY